MDVIFEPGRGPPFTIEVGFFDTVLEMKEKILKYQGIPIASQTFFLGGKILQDNWDIEFCELFHNSRIQLVIQPASPDVPPPASPPTNIGEPSSPPKVQAPQTTEANLRSLLPPPGPSATPSRPKKWKLNVLVNRGARKIEVEVNPSDRVKELRRELENLQPQLWFDLPSDGYFFIYKQDVMDDDRTFRWHGVKEGGTIEVFPGTVTSGSP